METTKIKVEVLVDALLPKARECWTLPEHITRWYAASEDWHTPRATNDVKVGGEGLPRGGTAADMTALVQRHPILPENTNRQEDLKRY